MVASYNPNGSIQALVFDFDGLILETESPIYQTWVELFESYNCRLSFDDWATIIGAADVEFDPMAELERQHGPLPDKDDVESRRAQREHEMVLTQPILPGVVEALETARELGLKIGLASSSPCSWVEGHLARLGLRDFFQAVKASDDVEFAKPDPALYRLAVEALGVAPERAVALEDSPNGMRSALSAGLRCVAIPNELTRRLPLPPEIDLRLDSLADMPLPELLAFLNGLPGRNDT